MQFTRLTALLLFLALLSALFAAWGLLGDTQQANSPALNRPVTAPQAAARVAPADTPHETARATRDATPTATPDQGLTPSPETSQPRRTTSRGSISGVVVDYRGYPVEGATVSACAGLNGIASENAARSLETVRSVQSDLANLAAGECAQCVSGDDGKFAIEGLDPGLRYQVFARSDAHGTASFRDSVRCGFDVRLQFNAEAIIHVRILDADGKPLSYAGMCVRKDYKYDKGTWQAVFGIDGKFAIEWKGWFDRVSFSAKGCHPSRYFTRDGLAAGDVEVRLQRGFLLHGVVTDSHGKPLSRAIVRLRSYKDPQGNKVPYESASWQPEKTLLSDRQGRYGIHSLSPGRYRLNANLGGCEDEREVDVAGDTEFDFSLDMGARVVIDVRDDDDKPLKQASIKFLDGNDAWVNQYEASAPGATRHEIIGLPLQVVTAIVERDGYCTQRLSLDLTSGRADVHCKMAKGALVEGTIVDGNGKLMHTMYMRWTMADGTAFGRSCHNGTFKLNPIPPGEWTVDIYSAADRANKVGSQSVRLKQGECKVTLVAECARSLTLIVTGDATHSIDVRLRRAGTSAWQLYRFYWNDVSPREDGVTLSGLPAGTYQVRASSDDRLFAPTRTVEVGDGTTTIELKVEAPNCVRLTSVVADGNAALHGLQTGDLLVEYDQQAVESLDDLRRLTSAAADRKGVPVTVIRDGNRLSLVVDGGLLGLQAEAARN